MSEDRPHDVGRKHTRRSADPESAALVERYRATMRSWLGRLLDELEGRPAPAGILPTEEAERVTVYPSTKDASALWDLAIKLGKELGSAIDPQPTAAPDVTRRPPRARRVAYGGR